MTEESKALAQIRENALVVARLAEEQMRMMARLDKAAIVIAGTVRDRTEPT